MTLSPSDAAPKSLSRYVLTGAAIAAIFPFIAFRFPAFGVLQTAPEHALLDLAIALSACFCSLQALMRYQSRQQSMFLWLSAGYLASGLLDGLHAMLSLQPVASFGGDRVAWSWTASSLVLGVFTALSVAPNPSAEGQRRPRLDALVVGGLAALVLAVLVPALLNPPLRSPIWPQFPVQRPFELLPAIAFAIALSRAWKRRDALDAPLRRMLFVALVLYISVHAGVSAWSTRPLDAFIGVSHLGRFIAHWLILMGLLQSSTNLLAEAESGRVRLAHQAEELEASERRIRSIVHHAPYAILSADEGGVVRSINPLAASMFGTSSPQAEGRPLASFFSTDLAGELEVMLGGEQAMRARMLQMKQAESSDDTGRSRNALNRETSGLRGDGSAFPVALTLTDAVAGGQRFFTAFVRDRTRAVEQERKINQALSLTSQILDQSGAAICSTDAAGLITRFNRTAQQWLGYGEPEVCGRLTPASFVDRAELQLHGKRLERERGLAATTDSEIFLALARRGEPDQREWTMIRKDGSRFPAHIAIAPLAEPGGKIHGFVLVASDLSHQKEVEKMKNEFVSTVSHELRTPLTSVRGSLGLLAGGIAGKLPPQAQSLLEIAQRNTERLILLINDILDMEKIEAGKMRFTFKSVDLDALAAEAVQTSDALATTRQVRLNLRTRVPNLRVYADDQRLLQVMGNLLSNAIKFSPPGSTIDIDVASGEGQARFTVTDRGSGIPEAAQGKIFQKFFQADSSTTREKSGTGLGLSICKALIERMEGQIAFRSRPGETVFHFELPLESVAAAASGGKRVLVVEDDSDAAAVLGEILRSAGYEVELARTAAAAKTMLQKRAYDCMTLDMLLPDQHGSALLGELRRNDWGRKVPVIVVSIYDPDNETQAAASAGRVVAWLTKPVDSQRLLTAVRNAHSGELQDSGVLLVEDDIPLGELMRRLLGDITTVTVARTLAEGRDQIQRYPFSLVILDLGLPDGPGRELLPVVKNVQPNTPVILFSEMAREEDLGGQVVRILSKSRTSDDELVSAVQEILHKREAGDGHAAENPAG